MQDLKKILSCIAPNLAMAIDGPFHGSAIKFIFDKANLKQSELNIDPIFLVKSFSENPQNFKSIKTIDTEFSQLMKSESVDLHAINREIAAQASAKMPKKTGSNNFGSLFISVIFLTAYFLMLGAIFFVEMSDTINMKVGENSMKSEMEILFGVFTMGVGQILSFWFSSSRRQNSAG